MVGFITRIIKYDVCLSIKLELTWFKFTMLMSMCEMNKARFDPLNKEPNVEFR